MSKSPEVVLITGFPAFTAWRLAKQQLADSAASVLLLMRENAREQFDRLTGTLPEAQRARLEALYGDVCDMDLGLAGDEHAKITQRVTVIHHLASVYYLHTTHKEAERVNVGGTREVLALARECHNLRAFVHYSTVSVSGSRKGVVMESELDEGQSFRNHYEETKFEAEKLVREAARQLPVIVIRLAIVVGDSRTGEIDRFEGPYHLMVLIVESRLDVSLPLPGRGSAPLYLTPIDFVTRAAVQLASDARALGRTFHLVDPCPLAARQVYELVAERAQRKAPRGSIPTGLARLLLRTPGIERVARAPLSMLDAMDSMVFYNCANTMELLEDTGIRCPRFADYAGNLVRYVRSVGADRRRLEDEVAPDPFDA